MTILEGNKLIAAFVGISFGYVQCNHPLDPVEYDYDFCFPEWLTEEQTEYLYEIEGPIDDLYDALKFHTSWDWLMPVWVKFRVWCWNNTGYDDSFEHFKDRFMSGVFNGKCEQSWYVATDFIQWYNTQKH